MKAKAARIRLWRITKANSDWFLLFAYTRRQAVNVWRDTHDEHDFHECTKVDDNEIIATDFGGDYVREYKARDWCLSQQPGPFASNTYEV
mgnify:CR=1 FL=1